MAGTTSSGDTGAAASLAGKIFVLLKALILLAKPGWRLALADKCL